MFLIYTDQNSSRLKYVFNFIFLEIYGFDFEITQNKDFFASYNNPKLNYSENQIDDEFFIESSGFLYETNIHEIKLEISKHDDFEIFFKTSNNFPFDIFSAIFYLLSRYEEYLDFKKDKYGRFSAKESLAFKNSFLDKPLVNIWLDFLKEKLKTIYSDLKFKHHHFNYISTIDIDSAYAYKGKSLFRSAISFLHKVFTFNFQESKLMLEVLFNFKKDPFDNFDIQDKIHNEFNIYPTYFILLGDYGKYDKNISHKYFSFKELIQKLSSKYTIGLHPSFKSNSIINMSKIELSRGNEILNKKISISRQHYLKILFPDTYRNLISLGMKADYSLGYASLSGFRASICTPFKFYDLAKEQATELVIYPFQIMDATYKYYNSDKGFTSSMKNYIDWTKKYNGTFISVFHNDSFAKLEWKNKYVSMLKYIFDD